MLSMSIKVTFSDDFIPLIEKKMSENAGYFIA